MLAGYTEGDPNLGPLGLTEAFVTNDVEVPEYVKFGPASAMTKVVRDDEGVAKARRDIDGVTFDIGSGRYRFELTAK